MELGVLQLEKKLWFLIEFIFNFYVGTKFKYINYMDIILGQIIMFKFIYK